MTSLAFILRLLVPAAAQVHAALLRWLTGDPAAGIQLSSHPLPVLVREVAARIGEAAGEGGPACGPAPWGPFPWCAVPALRG